MEYPDQLVVEIPVWVCGTQKWVTGLTKRTTCDDVIYALLYNDGKHEIENTDKYTIFERWRDVERPLQGRTKILKIWRAWGAEQCSVQLTMRHADEIGEYGEFLHSRRRRHRRTKHKEREPRRHSKSKTDQRNGSSESRLKTMEELAKLVIQQERRLHDIGHRIENTDQKIFHIESELHECRVAKDGENYLQEAYLNSGQDDSMTEFLRNVEPENLEMYIQFCERVIQLDDKIQNEESKIMDLSEQIHEQSTLNDAFHNADMYNTNVTDGNLETELAYLQADLNRIVSANMMQKYKAVEITKEIDYCDRVLHQKQEIIQQLQKELEYLEKCDEIVEELPKQKHNQSVDFFHTSTPISHHTASKVNQSTKRVEDNDADYVNIGAIMEWQEQEEQVSTCAQGIYEHEAGENSAKKHSFDTEDSFSVDTDNTSNDSQFGSVNQRDKFSNKFNQTRPLFQFPATNSLDNDELISERIQKEIYAYKSPRKCSDFTRSLTSLNGDRSFACTKSVDENDSNSDTGLSSMHSDESPNLLETLV
ncbi:ras association domain-containing protein 9-like [Saccostrea echinata]|uniref:ras association domain-containing protein 9-like n=1 Tax=Saccostrea echinata TaxID=191078 RepID=UPI002A819E8C|nr:ras association domain-containing protein 9-like [Saccostrea echinata]XP_061177040.1 ras association domain-containing protein 9-like [Saccostrea echinata]